MVTALNLAGLKDGISKGFLRESQVDPEPYQKALKSVGFVDVEMRTIEKSGGAFQAIFAHKR